MIGLGRTKPRRRIGVILWIWLEKTWPTQPVDTIRLLNKEKVPG